MEKGDPPNAGGGRPLGSRSFKTLLQEALAQTKKDKNGKPVELKQATAMQIIAIALSKDTDDNTKLKAFQIIRDTIGEQPETRQPLHITATLKIETPAEPMTPERAAAALKIIRGE